MQLSLLKIGDVEQIVSLATLLTKLNMKMPVKSATIVIRVGGTNMHEPNESTIHNSWSLTRINTL